MRIVVVGGGAAGMMAAIAAAGEGREVILLEKNEKLGKKLFITGKGRCNVTNACEKQEFFDNIVSNPDFMYSSFDRWSNWDMYGFLEDAGVPLKIERGGRVFPVSDKSSDILRALEQELSKRGVRIRLHTAVERVLVQNGQVCGVATGKSSGRPGDRKIWEADRVIVCTGGLSYPSTGSTGDGHRWALELGHSVTACRPALVPLEAAFACGLPCREVQGLALKNVGVTFFQDGKKVAGDFGELLFTHFGVSGPVILSASSRVGARLEKREVLLQINLKPALTDRQIGERLQREIAASPSGQIGSLLGGWMPRSLVPVVLRQAKIKPERKSGSISGAEREKLTDSITHLALTVRALRGYNEAIVTQGGISVKELWPASMESRRVAGLYFAGEALDLDAYTGGYNLQIAWSSGYAAGTAAAR